ncbi:DUF4912 domain-containing protein [Shouchella patagoniensis]|uniref:DUF4912 domain-containing protein n=1 Tax=Shouchella patagoniensis TaxID=228576 RepID=UPI000995A2D7|nr:DUF4912 domain-containing protein [Shouchella patagoniensis]
MNKPFLNKKAFIIRTEKERKQSSDALDRLSKRNCFLFTHSPTILVMVWSWSNEEQRLLEWQSGERFSSVKKCIVLHDVTWVNYDGHFSNRQIEILLPEMTGDWVFTNLESGRHYLGEIGVRTSEGRFLCVNRTNVVKLPQSNEPNQHQRHDWIHQVEVDNQEYLWSAYGSYIERGHL